VAAATLRTTGLLLGAWLFVRTHGTATTAVDAANLGFVAASLVILLTALLLTGIGRKGPGLLTGAKYAAFTLPVLGGQFLLNVLFQADSLLLRRFLAEAALGQGLGPEAADPLVGAYRAAQMFCFLPYQLLMSVTFVLFPLLAEANGRGQEEDVKRLVHGGLRLGALATGAMLSVLLASPRGLIALVYGNDAAVLGAAAMRPLALGLSAFALVGLITSALNSLGKPAASLKVTAIATALLLHVATATCVALVLTGAIAQGVLRRHAGAALHLPSLLRIGVAVAVAAFTTDLASAWLGYEGKLVTLAACSAAFAIYTLVLILLREVGTREVRQLRALLGAGGRR
jgi:stage V sporulation protein B